MKQKEDWYIQFITRFGDVDNSIITVDKGTHPFKIRMISKNYLPLLEKVIKYNKIS